MSEPDLAGVAYERARARYWRELVQLKIDAEYAQRYRDGLSSLLTWIDIIRAVVSVGAFGSWVAGVGFPQLWAGIIVVSQVGEAVLSKLPLTARQRGLVTFSHSLDAMLIDALREWEEIELESVDQRTVTRRRHTLMKLRHEAEVKSLPEGLPLKKKLYHLAEQDAARYFEANYETRPIHDLQNTRQVEH